MLVMKGEEFGTTATGVKMLDYCRFCYQKGAFTEPDITMEQMIERLASAMRMNKNMPEEQAKQTARETLLALKRWKQLPRIEPEK